MSSPQELAQLTVTELEPHAIYSRNEAIRNMYRMGHNTVAEDAAIAAIVQAHVQTLAMIRREQFELSRRAAPAPIPRYIDNMPKITTQVATDDQAPPQVNPDVHSI